MQYPAVTEHQTTPAAPSMRGSDVKAHDHAKQVPSFSGSGSTRNSRGVHFPDLSIGDLNSCGHRSMDWTAQQTGAYDVPVRSRWVAKKLYTLIPDRLSFTAHDNDDQTVSEIQKNPKLFYFSTDSQERYLPFCADFGPVNIGTLVHFCRAMRTREADRRLAKRHMVYYFTNDTESTSNAAFLLSAYLMLEHNFSIEQAIAPFSGLEGSPIVPFRDATYSISTFPLTLRDCLEGLEKARIHGWFDLHAFDTDAYEDMDAPDQGDMHRICPKFLAFRGPDERPYANVRKLQDLDDSAALHPRQYIPWFKDLGVNTIVRLNDPETYDRKVFAAAGFEHLDFFFGDCTTPSDALVLKFLAAVARSEGAVGVHCLAGLGRTGTLIGVWLILEHGFTAREAIAWMRIVRPGMVIGPQQHYLAEIEQRVRSGHFPPTKPSPKSPSAPPANLNKANLKSPRPAALASYRRPASDRAGDASSATPRGSGLSGLFPSPRSCGALPARPAQSASSVRSGASTVCGGGSSCSGAAADGEEPASEHLAQTVEAAMRQRSSRKRGGQ